MSTAKKKRLLTPGEIDDGISAFLTTAARNLDIGFALIGGVALQAYGYPRGTTDVDFILTDLPKEIEPLEAVDVLHIGGASYLALHSITIDLIVRQDGYKALYQEALKKAVDQAGLPVVTLEYLAAMKFLAARDKDLDAVRWILSEPGRVNSIGIYDLIGRHIGQYAKEAWLRFALPFFTKSTPEEYIE